MKDQKVKFFVVLSILTISYSCGIGVAQESNRNEIRSKVSEGGWNVVYGELINEAEYAKFVAACYAGKPEGYFGDYMSRTIERMSRNAPGTARDAIVDAIKKAFKDRGRTFDVGKIGIKAGIATYKRWNDVSTDVLTGGTERYKIRGPADTWTWGYRPKTKRIEKRIPLPNHHQPFVAFRIYGTSTAMSGSRPSRLQVIDFGSLDWNPIKTFGFRDWNNVRYKAQVVNGKFQTIKHGTTKWTPQQFIRVKKFDSETNAYRDAIVEVLRGKKYQYMYDGTTTWIQPGTAVQAVES